MKCLVRDPERAKALTRAGCRLAKGDVRDFGSVLAAFDNEGPGEDKDKIDIVINLVGILTESRRATYRDTHVTGVKNLLKASKERGGRRKRLFQITYGGKLALDHIKEMRTKLWNKMPEFAFDN